MLVSEKKVVRVAELAFMGGKVRGSEEAAVEIADYTCLGKKCIKHELVKAAGCHSA